MSASLLQVHQKLDRAEKHLQFLKDEIVPFASSRPYKLVPEFNGDETRVFLRFTKSPDVSVPAIIGDCLHNLRSSLDYIMGQLGLLNGHKIDENTPNFPIYLDGVKYSRKEKTIADFAGIKTINAPTIIKGLQPCGRVDDPLWLLHELSNIDKHRTLNVTVAGIFKNIATFTNWGDLTIRLKRYHTGGVVYDGAELAMINATEQEYVDHGVKVDIHGPVVVMLKEPGPWGAQPVEVLIEDILAHIRTKVLPAVDPFF